MISVISLLRSFLYDPRVKGIDVDDNKLLEIHRQILFEKPIMRHVFEGFYYNMIRRCEEKFVSEGVEVEIGSGSGFFKKVRPSLITSDIRTAHHIDRVLDAQNLNLENDSVRALYAINAFHHLPNPERFFQELSRVLKEGGGVY